ncbi:MAG: undecaprenyl-phosphate glucose phosphotransferase [Myxococcota bacterium]
MLKRHHRFFQSVQILRDVVLVAAAFLTAYVVRFSFPTVWPFGEVSPVEQAVRVGLLVIFTWPLVGWASGLYKSHRTRSILSEIFDASRAALVTFLVAITLTYFILDVRFSRGVFLVWTVAAVLFVSGARVTSRLSLRYLRSRGFNLRHVVIVGAGDLGERVLKTVIGQASLGLRAVGVVVPPEEADKVGSSMRGVPIVNTVDALRDIVRHESVDQVIVALPIEKLASLKSIMRSLSQETVDVRVVPDFYQFMTLCGGVEEFAGMPIINLQATPLEGWSSVLKRFFDIALAGAGLVVVTPLLALLALIVRLGSAGPVLYRQKRVGLDGHVFTMYKFRTMRTDAEANGARMTTPDDDRRTGVGTWLRRLSLDELPQLWNVLRGDMSLVGPRPERPEFIEEFTENIPRYALRHKIKAGMTGWAQVNGMRGQTSIAKRIEFDLYYIENWSFLLDVKILVRTVCGGFLSPNGY